MFAPDAAQLSAEDQLVEALAEALYAIARQEVKNKYEDNLQPVFNQ
jgi:hypothetical protein